MHRIMIQSIEDTKRFADILSQYVENGDCIILEGDLGAGKTTFSQFLGQSLGVKRKMSSPTFNIVKSYQVNDLNIHHMDCYRLEHSEEDIGFDEYFDDNALVIVEWAQFIQEYLPSEYLKLSFLYKDDDQRKIIIEAKGHQYNVIVEDIVNDYSVN